MADLAGLIGQNLEDGIMLQLATVSGGKPWVSTLYYVSDDKFNIYWVSKPNTRHSQEIASNPEVAAAVPLDADPATPNTAIQVSGRAEQVQDGEEIKRAIEHYARKFQRGQDYLDNFLAGNTERKLYKMVPSLVVLYDEKNFPDNPIQEWRSSIG